MWNWPCPSAYTPMIFVEALALIVDRLEKVVEAQRAGREVETAQLLLQTGVGRLPKPCL